MSVQTSPFEPANRMSDYPALQNFLAAYFHQDWQAEHDSADAVIRDFLDNESEQVIANVRDDLARLDALALDEQALARQLHALGCEYDPTRDAGTWRGWLQTLVARFERMPGEKNF